MVKPEPTDTPFKVPTRPEPDNFAKYKPKRRFWHRDWELRSVQDTAYNETRCLFVCNLTGKSKIQSVSGRWTMEQLRGLKP